MMLQYFFKNYVIIYKIKVKYNNMQYINNILHIIVFELNSKTRGTTLFGDLSTLRTR